MKTTFSDILHNILYLFYSVYSANDFSWSTQWITLLILRHIFQIIFLVWNFESVKHSLSTLDFSFDWTDNKDEQDCKEERWRE